MEPRSRNAADSLLAEGLTLEIINTLSGVARLDVKSRFFSRRIAADVDPVRSARSFGVDYVVDGVLELDSARVLVRGALTRTSTGRVVRPIRIERRRAELEGLQVAVAQEVAAAVVGRLLPAEQARFAVRRVDPRVTELLLSARALSQQYTAAALRQALVFTRQAIAIDSTYAPAWVRLGGCYGSLADFEPDSGVAHNARRMAANDRALALDSSNAEALSRLATIRVQRNDLSPRTEALARRGAALEPGVATGVHLAWTLLQIGKTGEALAVIREAARRDSLSPLAWAAAGYRLADARHFAEAANAWVRALTLRPSARDSAYLRHAWRWARLEAGDCASALVEGRSAQDLDLTTESLRCLVRTSEADSIIDGQLALSTISPGRRAIYLAWRNQPDSAFAVLDRALPSGLGLIIQHPAFGPYRQHPAYLALRRRMGLER
jgi:TolB-like protein